MTVAANAETVRQCDVARGKLTAATAAAKKATAAAATAVKGSEATTLPETDGWTSTKYADKPAATAQPKGSSGKDRLTAVNTQQRKLRTLATSPTCESRDDAAAVTTQATDTTATAKRLTAAATELTDDFHTFLADETTRITAEKAAAQKAAEEAAAKQAAEAEAAKQAAAAEAARQAAARAAGTSANGSAAAQPRSTSGAPAPGSTTSGQDDRVTSPWGSTAPRKGPDFVGGGGVGSPGEGPVRCVTDNGMGGTKFC
ncbi:hypothetical protein ACWGJ9_08335 [Curtobacterium citreum]